MVLSKKSLSLIVERSISSSHWIESPCQIIIKKPTLEPCLLHSINIPVKNTIISHLPCNHKISLSRKETSSPHSKSKVPVKASQKAILYLSLTNLPVKTSVQNLSPILNRPWSKPSNQIPQKSPCQTTQPTTNSTNYR